MRCLTMKMYEPVPRRAMAMKGQILRGDLPGGERWLEAAREGTGEG